MTLIYALPPQLGEVVAVFPINGERAFCILVDDNSWWSLGNGGTELVMTSSPMEIAPLSIFGILQNIYRDHQMVRLRGFIDPDHK